MFKSLSDCKDQVLVGVYEFIYNSNEDEWLHSSFIRHEVCRDELSSIFLSKILRFLVTDGVLEEAVVDDETYFTINAKGIVRAEKLVVAGAQIDGSVGIPASDRIVNVSHNQETVDEITDAVESADEAIRSSNTINEEQRSWIREHLDLGKSLLKLKRVSLSSAKSMLLTPLHSAWKNVAEEHGKQVIAKAIDLIRAWLGI